MLLKYVPSLTIKTGVVSSLGFSLCGRILAILDLEGEISLWDTSTGNRYHPTLTSGCRGRSASVWVDNRCFVCGLSDGSVGTCEILQEGISAKSLVKFYKKQVTESEIIGLSYHPSIGRLAVGSPKSARVLFKDTLGWEHESRIPNPQLAQNGSVQIVALAWMPESERELLIAYKSHGVSIWDTSTLSVLKIFNNGDIIRCGTLCFTSETFVAINDEQRVVLYHLGLGCRWLLPRLKGVISASSIHRHTGFVAGSSGKAQLIDIPLALVTQVLCEDSWSTKDEVVATSAFQNETESEFMIATASGHTCTVWKTEIC